MMTLVRAFKQKRPMVLHLPEQAHSPLHSGSSLSEGNVKCAEARVLNFQTVNHQALCPSSGCATFGTGGYLFCSSDAGVPSRASWKDEALYQMRNCLYAAASRCFSFSRHCSVLFRKRSWRRRLHKFRSGRPGTWRQRLHHTTALWFRPSHLLSGASCKSLRRDVCSSHPLGGGGHKPEVHRQCSHSSSGPSWRPVKNTGLTLRLAR